MSPHRHLLAGAAALLLLAAGMLTPAASTADDQHSITAQVRANPLTVELTEPAQPVRAGQPFVMRARIVNVSDHRVDDLEATLQTPQPMHTLSPEAVSVGSLDGGQAASVRWRVCTDQPGHYLLAAHADATVADADLTATSRAQQVEVKPHDSRGRGPRCNPN